jgi:hypothetical protein
VNNDTKQKVKKITIAVLIFSLGISIFLNYQYFKEKQEQQRQYETFLNHYYGAIHESLLSVNRLLDNEHQSKEQINRELINLSEHLNRFAYISSSAAYYVEGVYVSGINLFRLAANVIMLGGKHNGEQIPSFIENNQLTKSEKVYLTEIKKHLEYIHVKLYLEETGQENSHLSKDEFRSIGGYVTRIGSEHERLLEEYINSRG